MEQLTLATKVSHNTQLMTSQLGDELVMMDPEAGRYFGLNPTTRRIWDLLDEPRTVADVCKTLMTLYNVDEKTCRDQVLSVLTDLQGEGLILAHG